MYWIFTSGPIQNRGKLPGHLWETGNAHVGQSGLVTAGLHLGIVDISDGIVSIC